MRWPRLQAFYLSKTKKSNGILICEIRTSLWTRIIKKYWKLNVWNVIELFLWILVFFMTFPTYKKMAQWIRIILVRLVSTWVLNKPLKFRRNSLDRLRGIVVTNLKSAVLRKTRLKVQIRLPPIKFWLIAKLLSLVYKLNLQLPQKFCLNLFKTYRYFNWVFF